MGENPNTLFESAIHIAELDESVNMELATLKTYDNFATYFPDTTDRVRAVTYSESPSMILDMFDSGIRTLDVIIGDNTKDYRDSLRGNEQLAARLERLHRGDDLTIYLTNEGRSDLHSKLYLIEHDDETRTNIVTSANLSKNGWSSTRQKNIAVVFYTNGRTKLDTYFDEWYAEHKEYATEFMDDLTEQVRDLPDDERRERVFAFIDGRNSTQPETAEYQQSVTEQLDDVPVDRIGVLADFEDADDVDFTTAIVDQETADVTIRPSLAGYAGHQDTLREGMRHMDSVSISNSHIEMPIGTASQYSLQKFGTPKMWRSSIDDRLVLQRPDGRQQELMRSWDGSETMDTALGYLEEYIETVDEYGTTQNPAAAKALMFEVVLWFFWAPFSTEYAIEYERRGIDLDKFLPGLYVFGETNSGKGSVVKYALSLISDGVVTDMVDGSDLGKRALRKARNAGSLFPVVFDDIKAGKLDDEVYLNYREKHWSPDGARMPSLAFVSNDDLPTPRLQKRLKTLHFSIQYQNAHKQAQYVTSLIDRPNPLFALFAEEFAERPVAVPEHSNDTLQTVREVLDDMYDFAGRDVPDYAPFDEPAEKTYDTGKYFWQNVYDAENVHMGMRGDNLIATFDDTFSKYDTRTYERALPTAARGQSDGNVITIKNPGTALEWFPFDPLERQGILGRLLNR